MKKAIKEMNSVASKVACRNSFDLVPKVETGLLVPKLPKCQNAKMPKLPKLPKPAETCRNAVTCRNCQNSFGIRHFVTISS
jgi:hypothetical protein